MKKLVLVLAGLIICTYSWSQQLPAKSEFVGTFKMISGPVEKLVVTLENKVLMAEAEGVGKGEVF